MRTSLQSRSTVAALLAVPVLAVLILAGIGVAANLEAGARAERVRGLVPFTGALTTLVHELQRERALSDPQAGAGEQAPEAARDALLAVRRAVDGAAAAYRNAAVRVDGSDRDRELHRRLDAGLAQLAELQALRASVDRAAGAGTPAGAAATVFRRYTEIVGGLLAVGSEVGLRETGQDAELLRAVTAAAAFSRAEELADREREMAARADALGGLDPAERTRLAAIGGRQDALLDQFGALASPGQLERYGRAIPVADAEQAGRLRRAALEGGAGARSDLDLAAWSGAAAARVERMREVEAGLAGEVARLAAVADRTADRQALAYGVAFVLACCFAAVLLLLAPGPARLAATRKTPKQQPAGGFERLQAVPGRALAHPEAVRTSGLGPPPIVPVGREEPRRAAPVAELPPPVPRPPAPEPEAVPGLVDLARRGQELVDQQLELLGQAERDHADPRLPGRLLRLDRLAGRARRNAHNLVVLAGGEPSRRWDGPAPLAEVIAVAVRDNRDAPRVDVLVADDLMVPPVAADDLANLLGELIDNATAFSAPETRVRISGQTIGSGYVIEVEDRGLGMTDEELEGVNRHLAGRLVSGDDLEQRLGTWVAGRLAERHDVKVQLRRSAYGGVTALVFLPEPLTTAQPTTPPVDRRRASARPDAPGDREGEEPTGLPLRRYLTQVPEGPGQPLPKRAPHTSLAPDLAAAGDKGGPDAPGPRPTARSPEAVRIMLSKYRSGLERGRAEAARDLPDDPEAEPPA